MRTRRAGDQPDRIGRYTVIRRLGSGGMAEVFEVHDAKLDRSVALKRLMRHAAAEPELHAARQNRIRTREVLPQWDRATLQRTCATCTRTTPRFSLRRAS